MSSLAYRHQRVQRLRRLVGRRSARKEEGRFVIEGVNLLEEALDAQVQIEAVYLDGEWAREGGVLKGEDGLDCSGQTCGQYVASPHDRLGALLDRCLELGARVFELEPGVLARVAGTVRPSQCWPSSKLLEFELPDLGSVRPRLAVVCVDVRDPGNAGTVVRCAWAAGADGVVFCDGAVDPWNPKAVRSSAGAVLHTPIVTAGPAPDALREIGGWGLRRLGAVREGGMDYAVVDLTSPSALVLGNEAAGLPVELLDNEIDGWVSIPMPGGAESLNVGMAAAVLCFEAARQRRFGPPRQGASRRQQCPTWRRGENDGCRAFSAPTDELVHDVPPAAPIPGPTEPSRRQELIAAASHEVRQPIATIRGLTGMLIGHWAEFSDNDRTEMLKEVHHNAERIGRLLDELLEAGLSGRDHVVLRRREIDLSPLVAGVVKDVGILLPGPRGKRSAPPRPPQGNGGPLQTRAGLGQHIGKCLPARVAGRHRGRRGPETSAGSRRRRDIHLRQG